jgi:hypothetical protein
MRNERWPINEANVLAAGDASAMKLKNAKAAPHSVVASAREHKDTMMMMQTGRP